MPSAEAVPPLIHRSSFRIQNSEFVRVLLSGTEEYAGPGVVLTAAAGNGIVAADGGVAWAGVADLSLPFP